MTGVYNYVDDGIAVINKQNFIMVYEATVNAGIDLKQAKVKPNKLTKKVVVEIPKATILGVDVEYFFIPSISRSSVIITPSKFNLFLKISS